LNGWFGWMLGGSCLVMVVICSSLLFSNGTIMGRLRMWCVLCASVRVMFLVVGLDCAMCCWVLMMVFS